MTVRRTCFQRSSGLPLSSSVWRLWIVVLATVAVTTPVVVCMAIPWQVDAFFFRELRLPHYERLLGFRVGDVRGVTATIECGVEPVSHYGLIAVEPGGVFDRLGFRQGDWLVRYHHGAETGFLFDLRGACSDPRTIHLLASNAPRDVADVRSVVLRPSDLPRELCP